MADSCTRAEVIAAVRRIMGDPSQELLPDAVIDAYITLHETKYPLDSACCRLIYEVTVSCMDYVRKKLINEGTGVAGGSLKEKDGQREIEVRYGEKGLVGYWEDELNKFKKDPSEALPCMERFPNGEGNIKFGGVRQDEYNRVANDSNGRNGGAKLGSFPRNPTGLYPNKPFKY